jgi:hypothetical protein
MRPNGSARVAVAIALMALLGSDKVRPEDGDKPDPDALTMAPAVVCRSIEGYEDYVPLPGAATTSEEKLLVYYRPLNYRVEHAGKAYKVHLTQDGRIRRRGQKALLFSKDKLLDYEAKTPQPPGGVYLRNMISLKGLKPGEYDFEIILHDALNEKAVATQILPFRVIPVELNRSTDGHGLP